MTRAFIFSGVILLLLGCERLPAGPDTGGSASPEEIVVLSGFNVEDTVVVGAAGYRVGLYYDLSPYDSLRILFRAEQLSPGAPSAALAIRVGPVDYYRDTLDTRQKDVSIKVVCADLAKPYRSALTFFATDSDDPILLSRLRVIGWTAVSP